MPTTVAAHAHGHGVLILQRRGRKTITRQLRYSRPLPAGDVPGAPTRSGALRVAAGFPFATVLPVEFTLPAAA